MNFDKKKVFHTYMEMTGVFIELALLTYPEAGLNSGSAISFFISLFQVGMCRVVEWDE